MGGGRHAQPPHRRLPAFLLAPVLLLSAGLIYHASSAAFTAATTNANNDWQAGTVALSTDLPATARFSATGLVPGDTDTRCITVRYTGDVTVDVRLYASVSGGLGAYLDLTVEQGSGGSQSSCTGFAVASVLYSGTLSGLGSSHGDYAGGLVAWSPTGQDTRTYRISYTVQDDNAAQGLSATADFSWEARTP